MKTLNYENLKEEFMHKGHRFSDQGTKVTLDYRKLKESYKKKNRNFMSSHSRRKDKREKYQQKQWQPKVSPYWEKYLKVKKDGEKLTTPKDLSQIS